MNIQPAQRVNQIQEYYFSILLSGKTQKSINIFPEAP